MSKNEDLKKFKEAVDNSSELILFTDKNGTITYVNHIVEAMTGFTKEEVIGKQKGPWAGHMSDAFYKNMWKKIRVRKQVYNKQIINTKKNGSEFITDVKIIPILSTKGEIKFYVGVERDVTSEIHADKMKSEFISLTSHQLRTPLTGIKWICEILLRDQSLKHAHRDAIQDIFSSNERMIKLIADLLNVSNIESGRNFHITKVKCDLEGLLVAAIKENRVQMIQKNIEIEKDIQNVGMYTDAEKVVEILKNLIDNALKYSENSKKVKLNAKEQDGIVYIEVADEGIGISKDATKKVFSKFFRAPNAYKIDAEGTGLGLYIIGHLVKALKGKISFKSSLGKGTTFYLQFPKWL